MTKQDLLAIVGNKHTMKTYITSHARNKFNKTDQSKCCRICGYARHIHVCHVKDIKKFPMTAKISAINHIDNLVAMCPTHHWEFDHGFLSEIDPVVPPSHSSSFS